MTDPLSEEDALSLAAELFSDIMGGVQATTQLLWRSTYMPDDRILGLSIYEGVTERVSGGPDDGEELQFGYRACISRALRILRRPHVDFDCRTDVLPYIPPHVQITGKYKKVECVVYLLSEPPLGESLPVTAVMRNGHEVEQLPPEDWRPAATDPRVPPEDDVQPDVE